MGGPHRPLYMRAKAMDARKSNGCAYARAVEPRTCDARANKGFHLKPPLKRPNRASMGILPYISAIMR